MANNGVLRIVSGPHDGQTRKVESTAITSYCRTVRLFGTGSLPIQLLPPTKITRTFCIAFAQGRNQVMNSFSSRTVIYHSVRQSKGSFQSEEIASQPRDRYVPSSRS
jgi:hypothetical protein